MTARVLFSACLVGLILWALIIGAAAVVGLLIGATIRVLS